jgi:hypothetical protein
LIANGTRTMQYRRRLIALTAGTLVCVLPLTSCGDYDPEPRVAAGGSGQTTSTGMLDTAGQTAMGGAAGSAGQAATAGAAGAAPTGMGGSSPSTGGASGAAGSIEVTPVEADCEAVEPCGGEVVGTWVVAGSCLPVSGMANMSGFGLGCTEAPITGALEVTGTWAANADGTFTDGTTTTGDSQIELPPTCLTVSGTTTTCDRLGGALQSLGYASVTCVDAASGGGCTCAATVDQAGGLAVLAFGAPSSGTYTTANDVLTATGSSANVNAYAYCVSGNQMVMTPQATGTTGALTGTIVLVKP